MTACEALTEVGPGTVCHLDTDTPPELGDGDYSSQLPAEETLAQRGHLLPQASSWHRAPDYQGCCLPASLGPEVYRRVRQELVGWGPWTGRWVAGVWT